MLYNFLPGFTILESPFPGGDSAGYGPGTEEPAATGDYSGTWYDSAYDRYIYYLGADEADQPGFYYFDEARGDVFISAEPDPSWTREP